MPERFFHEPKRRSCVEDLKQMRIMPGHEFPKILQSDELFLPKIKKGKFS